MYHIKDNNNSYTVVIDGKVHNFTVDHIGYDNLVQALRDNDEKKFLECITFEDSFVHWSHGNFRLENEVIYRGNEELPAVISDRVIDMINEKFDVDPMLKFINNLYYSGDFRVVNELFNFMVHKNLPITDEGCLIAWKGVKKHTGAAFTDYAGRLVCTGDLVDCWTGRMRNNPGDVNTMERHQVANNPNNPCGPGLHCGELSYAKGWAEDAILMVEINPADVVSIPIDSSCKKMRACQIKVLSIYNDKLNEVEKLKYVVTSSEEVDDGDEWHYEEEDYHE
jgi:hypothetical protein